MQKILSVSVEGNTGQIEPLNGEASVNGNIVLNIVYLSSDGLVGNSTYTSSFIAKATDAKITPSQKIFAKIKNCEAVVNALSNNVAQVDCKVVLAGEMIGNDEITYLSGVGENVYYLSEETNYSRFEGSFNSSWIENVDTVLKQPVKKVVSTNCEVLVKNVESVKNIISVEAQLFTKLLYVADNEESTLKTAYLTTSIKQEIENSLVNDNSYAEVDLTVNKSNLKTTITEKDGEIKIGIEVPIDSVVKVFSTQQIKVTTDLFSTQNLTNVTSSSYLSTNHLDPIYFEKKVEGSLIMGENEPTIDKLLAVNSSKVVVTNESFENGQYSISGIIACNLIYLNEDDNSVNSVDVEVPFVVSTMSDYLDTTMLWSNIILKDVDVMVKKGKDVYIDANVCVYSYASKNEGGAIIVDMDETEPIAKKDCAIEIYFAKQGEKIWDIAKQMNVAPDAILSQNPGVGDMLEKDTELALYYKIRR